MLKNTLSLETGHFENGNAFVKYRETNLMEGGEFLVGISPGGGIRIFGRAEF
jgi:hypothetical protein